MLLLTFLSMVSPITLRNSSHPDKINNFLTRTEDQKLNPLRSCTKTLIQLKKKTTRESKDIKDILLIYAIEVQREQMEDE